MKFLLEYNKFKPDLDTFENPYFLEEKVGDFFDKARKFLYSIKKNYKNTDLQSTTNTKKYKYILYLISKDGSGFRFRYFRGKIHFSSYHINMENSKFDILNNFLKKEFDCIRTDSFMNGEEYILNSIPDKFPDIEDFIAWKDSKKFNL